MADPARFGLDVGIFGTLATAELVLEQARFAETAGFDSVWVADHVAFPTKFESKYPYNATGRFPAALDAPLLEPIATMGVLVGATTRIRIGTAALIMAYRNPVLMARMLVTLDQFSGGRIVLGAGVGWLAEEFDVLGAPPFNRRGWVTDEYLAIFKKLCAGGEVSHDGSAFSFDPVFSVPGSVQRPHPPIIVGGLSDAALRRVVRHGDGWLAMTMGENHLAERLAVLRGLAEAEGRRYEDLSLIYKLMIAPGPPRPSRFDAREPGSGTPAQIVDDMKMLFGLGFSTVILRFRSDSAAALAADMDRFVADLMPRV